MADQPDGLKVTLPGKEPFTLRRDGKGFVTVVRERIAMDHKAGEIRRIQWEGDLAFTLFSPDSNSYLVCGTMNTLRAWNVTDGKLLHEFAGHNCWIQAAAYSRDGKHLFSAGWQDQTLRMWDVASATEIRRFEGHEEALTSVAISPDEKLALTGSHDETLRVWNLATAKEVMKLEGHHGWTSGVFVSDTLALSFSSDDQALRLWDLQTGKVIRHLRDTPARSREWRC